MEWKFLFPPIKNALPSTVQKQVGTKESCEHFWRKVFGNKRYLSVEAQLVCTTAVSRKVWRLLLAFAWPFGILKRIGGKTQGRLPNKYFLKGFWWVVCGCLLTTRLKFLWKVPKLLEGFKKACHNPTWQMIDHTSHTVAYVSVSKKLLPKNTPKNAVQFFLTPESESCDLFGPPTFLFNIFVYFFGHLSHYWNKLILVMVKVNRSD